MTNHRQDGGKIVEAEDISAIASRDKLLVLAADEKTTVQVLNRISDGKHKMDQDHSGWFP